MAHDGPIKTKTAQGDTNSENQWTKEEGRVVNQDQRLKSIIISCLLDDIMVSVISCEITKDTWTDLVYGFKGPSDAKKNRIMDMKLEYQMFRAKPSKTLSHTYTRYKTMLHELANDGVNLSKHEINGKFKVQKDYKAEYKKIKAKLALLEASPSTSQTLKSFQPKNKDLVAQTFNWDEEVYEEETKVQVLMALVDDELLVGKNYACNSEWIDITMKKGTQPYQYATPSKQILKSKVKPYPACAHCGFNVHLSSDCRNYLECGIYGNSDHSTFVHNWIIQERGGVLAESSQSSESSIGEDDPSRQYQINSGISYYIITQGRSLSELTKESHVHEVSAPNEHENPHTKDVEGIPDLLNTERTQIQLQTELSNPQLTDDSSGNNFDVSVPITEPLVPKILSLKIPIMQQHVHILSLRISGQDIYILNL
uniref:Retrovirus-related Pol polyprotein from transposon TNT 1-94 n=1 Tax=Tanacetum cinerariifolium TaxID=118510 RepID=A0A699H4L5_TANCI|nr:retrovirus-related Pol polyprotein from transposon TNT 1-94 [Tanacetum cinerariifolium]